MKFKFICLLVVLLLIPFQSITAQDKELEQNESTFLLGSVFLFDGQEYSYHLTTDDVKNTPSWNPSEGNPPLSLYSAVNIAQENLKRLVKNSNLLIDRSIHLIEVDTEKWIYEISFSCRKSKCPEKEGGSFDILVKMDGSIIEPKLETKKRQIRIMVKGETQQVIGREEETATFLSNRSFQLGVA